MKIYKVELDARNPIEKIVKVPYNSEYNLELSWCGKLFPSSDIPAGLHATGYCTDSSNPTTMCFTGTVLCKTIYSTTTSGFANPCDNSKILPAVTKDRPEITYIPIIPVINRETGSLNYDISFNPIKVVGIDEDYYEITNESTLQNITTNECDVIIASPLGDSIKIDLCAGYGDILIGTNCSLHVRTNKLIINYVEIDINKLIADYKKS